MKTGSQWLLCHSDTVWHIYACRYWTEPRGHCCCVLRLNLLWGWATLRCLLQHAMKLNTFTSRNSATRTSLSLHIMSLWRTSQQRACICRFAMMFWWSTVTCIWPYWPHWMLLVLDNIICYSAPVLVAEYCDHFVCLSVCVCVSVHKHISGITLLIFTKFVVHIPCGCGSILLWQRCDTLCTSGFMDDVTFSRIGPYGDAWLPALQYQGRFWYLWMPCCLLSQSLVIEYSALFGYSPCLNIILYCVASVMCCCQNDTASIILMGCLCVHVSIRRSVIASRKFVNMISYKPLGRISPNLLVCWIMRQRWTH